MNLLLYLNKWSLTNFSWKTTHLCMPIKHITKHLRAPQDFLWLMPGFQTKRSQETFLGMKAKAWYKTQSLFWRQSDFDEVLNLTVHHHLFPHDKWWCLVASSSVVVSNVELLSGWWFMHDCGPLLFCGSILQGCLGAAIKRVLTTPTGRTLSLTCSVGVHLSDWWVMLWQRWLLFHFGGVVNYRYFLHNRKCKPCGLHAQNLDSQWTSTPPVGHSVWWQRCCFLWLPLCAECSSTWSLEDSRCLEPIGCTHNCLRPFHRWNT